jgi:hypothetical protein
METKVLYTAVMLDMKSKEMLKKEFAHIVPDGWEWIGHHMTIQLGELPGVLKHEMLGKRVNLEVISFGKDDKVMAVGVDGYWSKNKRPHITLAVNRSGGGKPVMSNHISTELWEPYKMDILLSGIVEEYK